MFRPPQPPIHPGARNLEHRIVGENLLELRVTGDPLAHCGTIIEQDSALASFAAPDVDTEDLRVSRRHVEIEQLEPGSLDNRLEKIPVVLRTLQHANFPSF